MAAKRNATGLASAMPRASLNDEELVSQGCLPNAASLDMYVKYTQLWGAQSERGGQGEGRANNARSDSVLSVPRMPRAPSLRPATKLLGRSSARSLLRLPNCTGRQRREEKEERREGKKEGVSSA